LFALLRGAPLVNINFKEFVIMIAPSTYFTYAIFTFIRRHGYTRPREVKLFSWENLLFEMARWPWILIACFEAVYAVVSRRKSVYKVTPKKMDSRLVKFYTILPYILIVSLNIATLILGTLNYENIGYVLFLIINTVFYTTLIIVITALHIRESADYLQSFLAKHAKHLTVSFMLLVCTLYSVNIMFAKQHYNIPKREFREPFHRTLLGKSQNELIIGDNTHDSKDTPKREFYKVNYGDTLWNIAWKYYNDGSLWYKLKTTEGSKTIKPNDIVEIVE
jgi:magnesium-transporting ATPase (P-type)